MTRIAARDGGAFSKQQVRQSIDGQTSLPAHGPCEMPVWGWEFYAVQGEDPARRERVAALIAQLLDYLASIQRN
jgi:hypothetical protein